MREETLEERKQKVLAQFNALEQKFENSVEECRQAINFASLKYGPDMRDQWIEAHKHNFSNALHDYSSRLRMLSRELSRLEAPGDQHRTSIRNDPKCAAIEARYQELQAQIDAIN